MVSDPVTCPSPEPDLDHTSPAEPTQARGAHGDLSGCEAVLTQKLKSLELQNTLPGQDLVYHKSLALDPSCLLTPPNTPQGMELAELEADLQGGARQQTKGNTTTSLNHQPGVTGGFRPETVPTDPQSVCRDDTNRWKTGRET